MSSGLPINTFSQAAEYRKRYLAYLALTAQVEAYNLQANQVYKQTGQPSRPPDTRTTTEKLADLEKLKVELRNGFLAITDGTQSNETVEQLTPEEIVFAVQQLPAIVTEIKPRFAKGIPAKALQTYIKELRRKFLAGSGVSYTGQEATAQQIMNALQAGMTQLGASGGPFAPSSAPAIQQPIEPVATPTEPQAVEPVVARPVGPGRPPIGQVTISPTGVVTIGMEAGLLGQMKKDPMFQTAARNFGPSSMEEWDAFPVPGALNPYPDTETFQKEFLKLWAKAQSPEVQAQFASGWERKRTLKTLKSALTPGVVAKLSMIPSTDEPDPFADIPPEEEFVKKPKFPLSEPPMAGVGMKPRSMVMRRSGEPASRYPRGREILGYGLSKPHSKKAIQIDISKGLAYNPAPSYVPFGKYAINPSKLSSGVFELKTMSGSAPAKYPIKKLSPQLTKIMNRMVGGRMPDEYDFNEMDLDDQNFLYDLANDAKIMDRLNIPTPKRSKDGEELNKFEILKGQIIAGNDNKELVKEFKQMLLKFSNDGRIKKSEARELLLDLTALGY